MKIAIDASRAVSAQPTGIELYSARLIQYLARLDTKNSYTLYTPVPPPDSFGELPPNFEWKVIPFKRFWTQIRLSLALLIDKPDLLVVPAHVLPLYMTQKSIVTLHDFAFELFPEAYSGFELWYQRYAARRAVAKASRIITPSKSTKNDLIKLHRADPSKVHVVPLGFDAHRFNDKVKVSPEIKKLKPYFLMVGRLEKRKNTAAAIRAFGALREKLPEETVKLLLIGKPGFGYEEVTKAKEALPLHIRRDVIELGYVHDDEVKEYLAAATALLVPSLYEGFGIPLLEAMAIGAPVITSDAASMPEVVDDAAILIDPGSIEEIMKAMELLLKHEISGHEFSKRGKERVKEFSWNKTAEQTLEIIEDVLHNKQEA